MLFEVHPKTSTLDIGQQQELMGRKAFEIRPVNARVKIKDSLTTPIPGNADIGHQQELMGAPKR